MPLPRPLCTLAIASFLALGASALQAAPAALTDEFYALNGGLSFHGIKGNLMVEGGPGIDFAMRKYAREHKLLPC